MRTSFSLYSRTEKVIAGTLIVALSFATFRVAFAWVNPFTEYSDILRTRSVIEQSYDSTSRYASRAEAFRIAIGIGWWPSGCSATPSATCDIESHARARGLVAPGLENTNLSIIIRANAIRLALQARGIAPSLAPSGFRDVDGKLAPAYVWYIAKAREIGCIQTAELFRPFDPATQGEYAKMVVCALDDSEETFSSAPTQSSGQYGSVPLSSVFTPSTPSGWSYPSGGANGNYALKSELDTLRTLVYALSGGVSHLPVSLSLASGLSLSGQELSLGLASFSTTGALSPADWSLLSAKENPLSFALGLTRIGNTVSLVTWADGQVLSMSGGLPTWIAPGAATAPVISVYGRLGAITAQAGDYDSDQVTEGSTNLYFTIGRAQDALSGTVAGINTNISNLWSSLTSLTNSYNTLATTVSNQGSDIASLSGNLTSIYTSINTLSGNLATLDSTVNALSNTVLTHTNAINTLSGTVANIATTLGSLSGSVDTLFSSISAITSDIATLSGQTATNTSDIAANTANISTLSGAVSTLVSDVATLQSQMSSLATQAHDAVTLGSANGLSLSGQELSLLLASPSTTGALSATDWNTFNSKISLTSLSASGPIGYDNTTGAFTLIPGTNGQILSVSGGLATWVDPAVVSLPVTSVFGRAGDVTAQAGDYHTMLVTESGSNLYFTDARAQGALSGSINTLQNQIDTLSGSLIALTNSVTTLSGTVSQNIADISTLSGGLASTNTTLANLSTTVDTLSGSLATLTTEVATLSWMVATNSADISTLSGSLATLSNTIDTLSGSLATLSGNVVNLTSTVTSLSGVVAGNSADIATLSGQTASNTANIAQNTANISILSGALASTNADISTLSGNLATLASQVSALTALSHDALTLGTTNGLSLSGQELSLSLASATTTGALSLTDYNAFVSAGSQAALNTADIASLSGMLASLSSQVTTNSADISTLSGQTATNNASIIQNTTDISTLSGTLASKISLTDLSATGGVSYNNLTGQLGDLFSFNSGLSRVGNTVGIMTGTDGEILAMSGGQVMWVAPGAATSPVSSVFGRLGAITAQSGDYDSDQVTEGSTNLYFTDIRAQNALSGTVAGIHANISTLSGVVAALSGWLATTNTNLTTLSGTVSTLSSAIATVSGSLATLSTTVDTLSWTVGTNTLNITTLSGALWALTTTVSTLSGAVDSIVTDLASLSGSVATNTSNIATHTADITSLSGSLATLSSSVSTLSGQVAALQSQAHDAVTIGIGNGLSLSGQEISLLLASISTTGALSATDWATFSAKENTLTFNNGLTRIWDTIGLTNGSNGQILSMVGGVPTWVAPASVSVPVDSVFGRTGDILPVAWDYDTMLVTESGSNLYFTEIRAQNALSGTVATLSWQIVTNTSNIATLSGILAIANADIATLSGSLATTNTNLATATGNIATLSGQTATNTTNINSLSGQTAANTTDISTLSGNIANTNSNLASLSGTVGSLSSNVSTLSGSLATLTSTVDTLSGNLASLSGQTATNTTNISTLSGSLATLTTTVGTLSGSLASLTTTVNTLSGQTQANTANITSLSGTVATLTSTVNALSGTVSTLSTTVSALSGSLATTNSNLSSLSGTVSTISTQVSTLSGQVSTLLSKMHDAVTLGTANGLSLSWQQISLALASSTVTGALSTADYTAFSWKVSLSSLLTGFAAGSGTVTASDSILQAFQKLQWSNTIQDTNIAGKQNALTFGSITSGSSGVTVTGGANSTVGPNVSISVAIASGSATGLLSPTDWLAFSWKQNAITIGTPANGLSLASNTLSLSLASATVTGALSPTAFASFSGKQNPITLTTTGNNGASTWTPATSTLNIPTYTLAGLGGISLTSLSGSNWVGYNNTTGQFTDLFTFNNGLTRVGNTIGLTNGTNGQVLTMVGWVPTWSTSGGSPVASVFGRTGSVIAQSGDYTTTQVTEWTNLYYTQARFDTAFGLKSTTDLAEWTNLYFTNARAIWSTLTGFAASSGTVLATDSILQALGKLQGTKIGLTSLSASGPLTYDNTTGVFGINQANTSTNGFLSSADWNTFNTKVGIVSGTANGLSIAGSGISLGLASTSATGALSATDWNTFSAKIGSINGLTWVTQTFAIGMNGTDFNIVSSGSVHTFNIPNAGTGSRWLVSTGAQTFSGAKSFNGTVTINSQQTGTGGLRFTQINSTSTGIASNGKVLTLDGSGNVVVANMAYGADVIAQKSTALALAVAPAIVPFNSITSNINNAYSGTTGIYTAPANDMYEISASMTFNFPANPNTVTSSACIGIRRAGVLIVESCDGNSNDTAGAAYSGSVNISAPISMTLGQTGAIVAYIKNVAAAAAPTFVPVATSNYLSITRVGQTSLVTSDERLKKDIETFTGGLADILSLRTVSYEYNGKSKNALNDGRKHVGILAQEVQSGSLGKWAISTGPDGFLRYDPNAVIYSLVNSIKELDTKKADTTKFFSGYTDEEYEASDDATALDRFSYMVKRSLAKIDPSLVYSGASISGTTISVIATDTTDLTPLQTEIQTLSGKIREMQTQIAEMESIQSPMALVASTGSTLSEEDITALSMIRGAVEWLFIEARTAFSDMVTFTREVVFESIVTFRDTVFFEARVVFSDPDMAGTATVTTSTQRVRVDFVRPYSVRPIVTISPVGHYEQGTVTNLTTTGFDIEVSSATSADLKFNWIALLVTSTRDSMTDAPVPVVPVEIPVEAPVPETTSPPSATGSLPEILTSSGSGESMPPPETETLTDTASGEMTEPTTASGESTPVVVPDEIVTDTPVEATSPEPVEPTPEVVSEVSLPPAPPTDPVVVSWEA